MHALNPQNEATAFLLTLSRGVSRGGAINRCTCHLINHHHYAPSTASLMAVQAMAELESFNKRATIDIESSTSYVVVINDHDGRRMALTVNDLIGFARNLNAEARHAQTVVEA